MLSACTLTAISLMTYLLTVHELSVLTIVTAGEKGKLIFFALDFGFDAG